MRRFAGAVVLLAVGAFLGSGLQRARSSAPSAPPAAMAPELVRRDLEVLRMAVQRFKLDVGRWPRTLGELRERPAGASWKGPYLEDAAPRDPWGRVYVYVAPTDRSRFRIASFGSDGLPGGTGEAADLFARD